MTAVMSVESKAQCNYDLWVGYYGYLYTYVSQLLSYKSVLIYTSWALSLQVQTAAKGRNQVHLTKLQMLANCSRCFQTPPSSFTRIFAL